MVQLLDTEDSVMADQTSTQEAAQALFCAMADYVGISKIENVFNNKKYPIYTLFKEDWNKNNKNISIQNIFQNHVTAPGVTLSNIESLFKADSGWYQSSVSIAKKLIQDIDTISRQFNKIKTPNWSDILYVRGDSDIMKNIENIFKIANKTQQKIGGVVLGDVNKWSPADIYFASNDAKKTIKNLLDEGIKNPITFKRMNSVLNKLITDGELLPVSLKKQPGEVHIVKVNFDRKKELQEIEKYGYNGTSQWKLYSENSPQTRDLKIYFEKNSQKSYIKTRHDASSNVLKTEVEISGALARGGSIGSVGILTKLISVVDPAFSQKFLNAYNDGQIEFTKRMKDKDMILLKSKDKKIFDQIRGKYSGLLITNKVFPMYIQWLNSNKKRSDAYVQMIYQYITSRTPVSGNFIIAK
jgi:hypothetical protein